MSNDPHHLDYFTPRGQGLVRVYSARDAMEAEFVRGLLDEAGISAVVQGGMVNAVLGPALGAAVAAEVFVREQDVVAAVGVVEEYERGKHAGGEPWTCPTCGERIEGQFTHCWKCGAGRGGTSAEEGSDR